MKTNPDSNEEEALLEAVLRDDAWLAANSAGRTQALRAFQTRGRIRRLARYGTGLAVVAACLAHWLPRMASPTPVRLAEQIARSPATPENSQHLTDRQLLALFPPGSCFLAEVDGKTKLVFYDPAIEREYVSDTGTPYALGP